MTHLNFKTLALLFQNQSHLVMPSTHIEPNHTKAGLFTFPCLHACQWALAFWGMVGGPAVTAGGSQKQRQLGPPWPGQMQRPQLLLQGQLQMLQEQQPPADWLCLTFSHQLTSHLQCIVHQALEVLGLGVSASAGHRQDFFLVVCQGVELEQSLLKNSTTSILPIEHLQYHCLIVDCSSVAGVRMIECDGVIIPQCSQKMKYILGKVGYVHVYTTKLSKM